MIGRETSVGGEQRYWEALAEGHLELPRCAQCGQWHWPATWRCGECGSWDHQWVEQPLTGTIFTWTRTWHKFGGTETFDTPFVSLIVALAEAPVRLAGVLEKKDDENATNIRIGAPVTGRIVTRHFGDRSLNALSWKLMS